VSINVTLNLNDSKSVELYPCSGHLYARGRQLLQLVDNRPQ